MDNQDPILLICDFDGTLYPFPENGMDKLEECLARASHEISNGAWERDRCIKDGIDSYYTTGFSFLRVSTAFNMSMAEASLIHHSNIIFDLERDEDVIEAFRGLDRRLVHPMILTQGSWCNMDRHMPKIGLENVIPRNMRVTVDDHGYDRIKANSEYPWIYAKLRAEFVTGHNFKPENIYVFEDTPKNLVIPDQLGWKTIYTHHGKPLAELPPYIHEQVTNMADSLREFPQRGAPALNPVATLNSAAPA